MSREDKPSAHSLWYPYSDAGPEAETYIHFLLEQLEGAHARVMKLWLRIKNQDVGDYYDRCADDASHVRVQLLRAERRGDPPERIRALKRLLERVLDTGD